MTEKFHFRPKGAKSKADEIVLPWAKDAISAGFIRRNRKNADSDELGWLMLEHIADEETLEKVDALTIGEFAEFMTQWQGADSNGAGPSVGES